MLQKLVIVGASVSMVALFSLSLTGCAPGNNTGGATVAGAAAGGLLGAAAVGGNNAWLGALGGAVVGGIVGNQIGRYMDRQDRANMRRAVINTPLGKQASWTNQHSDITYTVRPIRNYHDEGRYCREYRTTIEINGKPRKAYGNACRQPDGSWKIVH